MQLSDEEIQENIFTQFFAGYETTGSTMTRLLQQLKRSPNVLLRLNEEQHQLRQEYGPELNGALTMMIVIGFKSMKIVVTKVVRMMVHNVTISNVTCTWQDAVALHML